VSEAIIPRWEWRMFAERFGAAERWLALLATAPPILAVMRKTGDDRHG
jgi:hypothetical protein